MTVSKALVSFALAIFACACTAPEPPKAPPRPATDEAAVSFKLIYAGVKDDDAELRYLSGDRAEDSDEGRHAYRLVCLAHQTERDDVLESLSAHAQMHALVRASWFAVHCNPSADRKVEDGVVLSQETDRQPEPGELGEVLAVCDADAGVPSPKQYTRTAREVMAQARRDACEDAQ